MLTELFATHYREWIFQGSANYQLWFGGGCNINFKSIDPQDDRPDELITEITANIWQRIQRLGYKPDEVILVNSHPSCIPGIVYIDNTDRITIETIGQPPLHYLGENYSIHPWDNTNTLEFEGVFTFKDYLLMMKPGDCFCLLITAQTNQGPCIGIVHASRKAVLSGITFSWIPKLLAECDNDPSKISIVIPPGLQQANHVLQPEYVSQEGESIDTIKAKLGDYCLKDTDGWHLDIENYLLARLNKHGIINITCSNQDTYSLHAMGCGYSRRRALQTQERRVGNMVALWLPDKLNHRKRLTNFDN